MGQNPSPLTFPSSYSKAVPQYGQLRQSAWAGRWQLGQALAGPTGGWPLPGWPMALTNQAMPSTIRTTKPTGNSHMNSIPIPPKGAKPQPPIIPGLIIPQPLSPPYQPNPPIRLAPIKSANTATMLKIVTTVQLAFIVSTPLNDARARLSSGRSRSVAPRRKGRLARLDQRFARTRDTRSCAASSRGSDRRQNRIAQRLTTT